MRLTVWTRFARWLLGATVGSLLTLLTLAAAPALARTVLELDPARQPVALMDWGDVWLDEAGAKSAQAVAADRDIAWQPTRQGAVYPLKHGAALWVRFTIPPAPDAERWYLEIPYPSVDLVSLYTPDSVGQWTAVSAGDTLAVSSWPVPHRHPLLPIAVSAEEPRHYLLRVENPHSFGAPLSFVSESYLSRHEQRTSLILGMYFGLAGLAATLALLSALSLRDYAYGMYALSVTMMALTQAALTGIAGLHLWPGQAWWNNVSPLVLPVVALGTFMWFFAAVVSMPERSRRLNAVLMGTGVVGMAIGIGVMLVEPGHRLYLMSSYMVVATAIGLLSVAWAARRGDRYALALLAAGLPVVIGSMFPLARVLGAIPVSFWTMHGMQVGIAIELPLVLTILMLRSQQRREHNRRIQGLDRIDPATGLITAPVFTERLERMIARSTRLKHQSALLLVEIVNMDQLRRDFDRGAAEEMPLRVAGRLMSAAREIDSVARLSDLRFGMLVEGPLPPEAANSAGPRVVARCLMPFRNKPPEWVAQVRVAQALVPLDGADAAVLLLRLEELLANVPADSRRAIFTLDD